MSVKPEALGPLFVARQLDAAEAALTQAQKVTDDRSIADACAAARREISGSVKRSRLVLEAAGGAQQMNLEDTQPNGASNDD